jgi:phosphate starvation-inducible PhoH-like protein
MSTKKAPRKRKEVDITNEMSEHMKKNFDCEHLVLKNRFQLTSNQTKFYYLTQNPNTNMVFVDGVAGTAKTYVAVYGALELLKDRHVDQIIYIRTVVESSSKSIGALPGELDDKFSPYSMPLMDKLGEILSLNDSRCLIDNHYIKAIPVNFTRGLTFNNSAVILDETQNMTKSEITTILTRFGRRSKYFVCGDTNQTDIKDSGFKEVFKAFNTDHSFKNNIHCINFDADDIVRSPILKHITQVLKV